MIGKIVIVVMIIAGFLAGAYGAEMLRPKPELAEGTEAEAAEGHDTAAKDQPPAEAAWFRIPNQFFIPILRNDTVQGVMVLTLTVETTQPQLTAVQQQEHRLRDALLGALMIHANTGGFDGNFTTEVHLAALRKKLVAAGQKVSGQSIVNILIEDIARQDQ